MHKGELETRETSIRIGRTRGIGRARLRAGRGDTPSRSGSASSGQSCSVRDISRTEPENDPQEGDSMNVNTKCKSRELLYRV